MLGKSSKKFSINYLNSPHRVIKLCACIILVKGMSNFIGPALPPHLQKKYESDETSDEKALHSQEKDNFYGSSLPSARSENEDQHSKQPIIGPSMPYLNTTNVESSSSPDTRTIGPMLPHLENKFLTKDNPINEDEDEDNSVLVLHADISDEETYGDDPKEEIYGPALPPGIKAGATKSVEGAQRSIMGPNLPPGMTLNASLDPHESSDSDSEIVGPLPATEASESGSYIQNQLNERALRMKRKLAGKDSEGNEPVKRESWMLELPPDRAADFGLGPRQFRARAKLDAGDRSVWTDTPADRLKKKHSEVEKTDVATELELKAIHERDEDMEHLVSQHSSKKRKESLLATHQKELKKKKKKDKEEGKREERRPFDRNVDLQANRFDEAQKKAIFKKAQLLNDRFSSGQSKFL